MKKILKILLIENNTINSENLTQILDRVNLDLDITEVDSTQDAISTFKKEDFDSVLLQHPLPEKNGLELIQLLCTLKSTVPIIVISTQNDEEIALEIIKAGAYYYLSQSEITSGVIERALRQSIRIHKTEVALKQANRRLKTRNQLLKKKNKELQRQRQKIKLQNLQLKQAYRLKSQFLSTLSHELRTPMNAIMGFSQILLRNYPDPLTPHQTDMLQRIYGNSKNLLTMINEVLDFSELETGNFTFKPEEFDLANFVRMSVEEIRSLAVEKDLTLEVELNLENPIVENDRFCLRSILLNLLSNALKFTFTGGVVVKIWELNNNRLAIAVQDTGIGIASDSLQTIFEPFRQVDQSTSRTHNGTGLGLAIVHSLVKMIGGKITVDSELNQGSVFQVEIPRTVQIESHT